MTKVYHEKYYPRTKNDIFGIVRKNKAGNWDHDPDFDANERSTSISKIEDYFQNSWDNLQKQGYYCVRLISYIYVPDHHKKLIREINAEPPQPLHSPQANSEGNLTG
jgi:hypothetical protein